MAIPIYQDQLKEQGLPGPRMSGNSADAYGASVFKEAANFGVALGKKIDEFEDAETLEAMNNFQMEMDQYHLDPKKGILTTMRGKNAIGLSDTALGHMRSRAGEYRDQLRSYRAQKNFDRMSAQYIEGRHRGNMSFETQNVDEYEMNAATSSLDLAFAKARDSLQDNDAFESALFSGNQSIFFVWNKQGLGKDALTKMQQDFYDKMVAARAQRWAMEDYDGAVKWLGAIGYDKYRALGEGTINAFETHKAQMALEDLQMDMAKFLNDPDNGLYNTAIGERASGSMEVAMTEYYARAAEIRRGITGQSAQRAFDLAVAKGSVSLFRQASAHEAQEVLKEALGENAAAYNNALQAIAGNYKDDETFEREWYKAREAIFNSAYYKGLGDEQKKELHHKVDEAFILSRYVPWANEDFVAATAWLKGRDIADVKTYGGGAVKGYVGNHPSFKNNKVEMRLSQWDDMILAASKKYNVPPNLIRAVINQESKGNPNAKSGAGALGLMQVVPKYHPELKNPLDPAANIDYGTKYLASLIEKYNGNLDLALAAYNGGPDRLDRRKLDITRMPKETQDYVKSVNGYLRNYNSLTSEANAEGQDFTMLEAVKGSPFDTLSETGKANVIKQMDPMLGDQIAKALIDNGFGNDISTNKAHEIIDGMNITRSQKEAAKEAFTSQWSAAQRHRAAQERETQEFQQNNYATMVDGILNGADVTQASVNKAYSDGMIDLAQKINLTKDLQRIDRASQSELTAKKIAQAAGMNWDIMNDQEKYEYKVMAAYGNDLNGFVVKTREATDLLTQGIINGTVTKTDVDRAATALLISPDAKDYLNKLVSSNSNDLSAFEDALLGRMYREFQPKSADGNGFHDSDRYYQEIMSQQRWLDTKSKWKTDVKNIITQADGDVARAKDQIYKYLSEERAALQAEIAAAGGWGRNDTTWTVLGNIYGAMQNLNMVTLWNRAMGINDRTNLASDGWIYDDIYTNEAMAIRGLDDEWTAFGKDNDQHRRDARTADLGFVKGTFSRPYPENGSFSEQMNWVRQVLDNPNSTQDDRQRALNKLMLAEYTQLEYGDM